LLRLCVKLITCCHLEFLRYLVYQYINTLTVTSFLYMTLNVTDSNI